MLLANVAHHGRPVPFCICCRPAWIHAVASREKCLLLGVHGGGCLQLFLKVPKMPHLPLLLMLLLLLLLLLMLILLPLPLLLPVRLHTPASKFPPFGPAVAACVNRCIEE